MGCYENTIPKPKHFDKTVMMLLKKQKQQQQKLNKQFV